MQNTYQEKILDLENTNNSINKKLEGGIKFKIKSNSSQKEKVCFHYKSP